VEKGDDLPVWWARQVGYPHWSARPRKTAHAARGWWH
jgi:hypothetical protein